MWSERLVGEAVRFAKTFRGLQEGEIMETSKSRSLIQRRS